MLRLQQWAEWRWPHLPAFQVQIAEIPEEQARVILQFRKDLRNVAPKAVKAALDEIRLDVMGVFLDFLSSQSRPPIPVWFRSSGWAACSIGTLGAKRHRRRPRSDCRPRTGVSRSNQLGDCAAHRKLSGSCEGRCRSALCWQSGRRSVPTPGRRDRKPSLHIGCRPRSGSGYEQGPLHPPGLRNRCMTSGTKAFECYRRRRLFATVPNL